MIIALLTDFGNRDWYVASMKGAIRSLGKKFNFLPEIIDISHNIPSFSIGFGAFSLYATYKCFPEGTVFCAVVDPGVGSKRNIVALSTDKYFFIAPDNGLLAYIIQREEVKSVVYVKEQKFFLENVSSTFHGRDIFAPISFHVAKNQKVEDLGPVCKKEALVKGDCPVLLNKIEEDSVAKVVLEDTFGNLVTNVPCSFAENVSFIYKEKVIPLYQNYSQASTDEIFCVKGSSGFLELSVRENSAAKIMNKTSNDNLEFRIK
jgi:S-adenosylmethionine hydrolase